MQIKFSTKIIYLIIAVIAAIGCWLYVDIVQAPNTTKIIRNVPVTFYGEDVLEEQGYMITEGKDTTVTFSVTGTRSAVSQLNKNNTSITVQAASQIDGEGEYELVYSEVFPNTVSAANLKVSDRSTDTIKVTVVQMTSITLELEGEFTGTAAEGALYDVNDFQFEVPSVTVSGERSIIDTISRAVVKLNEQNLNTTWQGELDILLEDEDGNVIDTSDLTMDATSTFVIFPIRIVKELPLSVNLIDGGGATADDATVTISPATVMVTGTEDELAAIENINLGSIDLEDVITSDTYTFDVTTPDNIELLNGNSSADVTVVISDSLVTRTVTVDAEDFVITGLDEAITAEIQTQSIVIRLRGAKDIMDIVMDEDVYIELDLSGYSIGDVGERTVNATVKVKGFSDIGAIGEYQAIVVLGMAGQ